MCTGTFIRDDVVLTAAHCNLPVRSYEKLLDVTVFGPGLSRKTPLVATKTVAQPDYRDYTDVGLVFFPAGSAPALAKLATVPGKSGDKVRFVGFGRDMFRADTRGLGRKRIGTNVMDNANGLVTITNEFSPYKTPAPGQSIFIKGDSGGPLFDSQGDILAVVSRSLTLERPHPQIPLRNYVAHVHMQFPSVTEPRNQTFISGALAEPIVDVSDSILSQAGAWCTTGAKACFVFCDSTARAVSSVSGFGKTKGLDGQDQWCRIADEAAIATSFSAPFESLPKPVLQTLDKNPK